ncbi:2-oxo-4-hydroxy-4-carboxy-5-ureidoimidazoline decarboxylase [Nonomuraea longicatena]|uniref:2-oxo-4-hydroxy-4-carboxy-5-ureidoimidazoline decarboxylase n=1 Tax=Nonomuraea longicatena TaxID=83682 RepID=A0ABN1PQ98_9ACTN
MPNPRNPAGLSEFNALSEKDAESALLACCGSRAFARAVARLRPYRDLDSLTACAEAAVRALRWPDVLEALGAHPRIGERPTQRWSRQEQAGVETADRAALADGNRAYEERFGHVYLVCATGLTGRELLERLTGRLGNDADGERHVVRDELAKITRLRMAKLVAP